MRSNTANITSFQYVEAYLSHARMVSQSEKKEKDALKAR